MLETFILFVLSELNISKLLIVALLEIFILPTIFVLPNIFKLLIIDKLDIYALDKLALSDTNKLFK